MTTVTPLRPREPWFRFQAASSDEAELFIYNDIGTDWFGEGITAESFTEELGKIKARTLNVRINSNGGSVFDGLAIYNALVRHPSTVVTHIDGIAASIASVVALAGSEIRMAKNAFFMIHQPHGVAFGNAKDMREMAATLETVSGSLVGVYRDRSGKPETDIRAWMDAETWFNASQAQDAGFVDEVTKNQAVAAHADLTRFRKVPAELADMAVERPPVQHDPESPFGGPMGEKAMMRWVEMRQLAESIGLK
jgi:ATP-dependent Clp protease, protease subunit